MKRFAFMKSCDSCTARQKPRNFLKPGLANPIILNTEVVDYRGGLARREVTEFAFLQYLLGRQCQLLRVLRLWQDIRRHVLAAVSETPQLLNTAPEVKEALVTDGAIYAVFEAVWSTQVLFAFAHVVNESPIDAAGLRRRAIQKCILLGARTSMVGELSCLLYTSPSPRDRQKSRMPSSA
eukprot:TRINITY_DN6033_c0_g1_i7.p1 TRINITY_DN6033_c0_g1~~TRINITY_DN6033_c0_g1_i7.p1  ORF type:complete len:180 (+),score=35.27 TRINITY_DN6033_c0_g1_i7:296-835(+)